MLPRAYSFNQENVLVLARDFVPNGPDRDGAPAHVVEMMCRTPHKNMEFLPYLSIAG